MAGYLVVSVISGILGAAISYFGFGAGVLSAGLWYIIGCWAGFAASVALFLIRDGHQQPPLPHLQQQSSFR